MPADEAPKAFDVERQVKPRRWLVHYRGKFVAPKSGTLFWIRPGRWNSRIAEFMARSACTPAKFRGSRLRMVASGLRHAWRVSSHWLFLFILIFIIEAQMQWRRACGGLKSEPDWQFEHRTSNVEWRVGN
jgi:hypothetical protein